MVEGILAPSISHISFFSVFLEMGGCQSSLAGCFNTKPWALTTGWCFWDLLGAHFGKLSGVGFLQPGQNLCSQNWDFSVKDWDIINGN